jgi:8-oxo-dGTP pyrophosphatase MutT (NUDIX family)
MEIRDASTVMLLRDGTDGIEVFMVRRHLNSDFVGGAYVFPGGAVDPEDAAGLAELVDGLDDVGASAQLGVERNGLRFYVAAVREVFEEAGVLLAYDESGRWIDSWDKGDIERFVEHRRRLNNRETTMTEVCREERLRIAGDRLALFSHWITPPGPPRRFDTRFFLAAMPEHQVPLHDDTETVASMWVRPADAIARAEAGEVQIIFPTIKNLEQVGRFATVDDAIAAARARTAVPVMLPKVVRDEGGIRVLIPGDEGYEDAEEVDGTFPPGHDANPSGRVERLQP